MRRLICRIVGHQWEPVSVATLVVMPGVGPVAEFVPSSEGAFRACERCRRVEPTTQGAAASPLSHEADPEGCVE